MAARGGSFLNSMFDNFRLSSKYSFSSKLKASSSFHVDISSSVKGKTHLRPVDYVPSVDTTLSIAPAKMRVALITEHIIYLFSVSPY